MGRFADVGGPTSSLQELHLSGISPPALLSILSSTNDLVDLRLHDLPVTDHVSPQAMVAGLAVMTKLESLTIGFNPYFLASLHPLPALNFSARATLPTLTQFQYRGSHTYLEDLVAQLDTPQLFDLTIQIDDQSIVWQFYQLFQFIDRAEDLKLAQFRHAHAEIHSSNLFIHFNNAQTGQHTTHLTLGKVDHTAYDQLQFAGALLSQAPAITSTVRNLSITLLSQMVGYLDHTTLLGFLYPFVTAETLCIRGGFTDIFPPMLNDLSDELITKVLPALHLLNFEDKPPELVKKLLLPFIKKRWFIGHPPLTIVNG